MISNRTVAILFLVAFVAPVAFSSNTPKPSLLNKLIFGVKKLAPRFGTREITTPPLITDNTVEPAKIQERNRELPDGTQGTSLPNKSSLKTRRGRAPKPREVLVDTTKDVSPVEVQKGSTEVISTSQELSVPQVGNQFKTLVEKGEYEKIFELGKDMSNKEFLKQLCPVIETPDQYTGIVSYLKRWNLVESFYVHGNIEVVKEAIIESRVYVNTHYVDDGDLETALILAITSDNHTRAIDFLNLRKEITIEKDEQLKQEGWLSSFEIFMRKSLYHLTPGSDGMALKRFLTHRGDELRGKYPDILDTLCQMLVYHMRSRLHHPEVEKLLIDLMGQPSLFTPMIFAKGFLFDAREKCILFTPEAIANSFKFETNAKCYSYIIKYAWDEAVKEGLEWERRVKSEDLWQAIKRVHSTQFFGAFPPTPAALDAVLKNFPTKQKLEEDWNKKYAKIFYEKLLSLGSISSILPTALWLIISGYAVSLMDTDGLTTAVELILTGKLY